MKPTLLELYNLYADQAYGKFWVFIYLFGLICMASLFIHLSELSDKMERREREEEKIKVPFLSLELDKINLFAGIFIALAIQVAISLPFKMASHTNNFYLKYTNEYSAGNFNPKVLNICEDLYKGHDNRIDIEILYLCVAESEKELKLDVSRIKNGIPIFSLNKDYNVLLSNALQEEKIPFIKTEMSFEKLDDIKILNGGEDFTTLAPRKLERKHEYYSSSDCGCGCVTNYSLKITTYKDLSNFEYVSFRKRKEE